MLRSLSRITNCQILPACFIQKDPKIFQNYRHISNSKVKGQEDDEEQIILRSKPEENKFSKEIIGKVNKQIVSKTHGRLFAVVHVSGFQYVITTNDLLAIVGPFAPTIGDKIRLEKVMCVGSSNFTLYGRPLLPKDLVRIEATIVEKSLLSTKVRIRHKRDAKKFERSPYSVLRINSVLIDYPIDNLPAVQGDRGTIY